MYLPTSLAWQIVLKAAGYVLSGHRHVLSVHWGDMSLISGSILQSSSLKQLSPIPEIKYVS